MADSLLLWLRTLERRHPKSIDLGLERCSEVFNAMGAPSPAPLIYTVAGTNGKGSVVAYLSTVLSAAGFRCGSYTSPHILEFNERVRIEGKPVNDRELVASFEATEKARNGISLTYFEFTTLAAFRLMHRAGLDAAVLEVGLGGRLDTVNLVDPDCAVITAIGLDHQDYLGNDRESIGREKAGIIRPGIPVICADRSPPRSLLGRARELGAELKVLGREFRAGQPGKTEFRLSIGSEQFRVPLPSMPGRHQVDNLATALTAIHALLPGVLEERLKWADQIRGLKLPGRLAGNSADPRFVLDVGHNPLAAAVVASHLAANRGGKVNVHCVLGMLRDKDAGEVARLLSKEVTHWYCAGLPGNRGQSGADLAGKIKNHASGSTVDAFDTVADAVEAARSIAGGEDRILVFGSFETVASAMRVLSLISRQQALA